MPNILNLTRLAHCIGSITPSHPLTTVFALASAIAWAASAALSVRRATASAAISFLAACLALASVILAVFSL
jgi:hypothetical protein